MESVTFGVLGSLSAERDAAALGLGGRRQRAVLAVLLLNRNRAVSRERIIDSVWEDDPPETARNTVQVYVSTLRRILGADRLVTEPGGYRLVVEPDELDAARLEQRLAEATRAIAAGEPHAAVAALDQALALWRGPALGDLAGDGFALAEAARLESLRLAARELRAEAQLLLGRLEPAIAELEALLRDEPLREHARALLMRGLYAAGRQADALAVYREGREELVEQLGLDPGPELQDLERAILRQEASLLTAAAPPLVRIPSPPTPLVDRVRELAAVLDLLRGDARVVSICGLGGVGKTRLAVAVAGEAVADFPEGVVWVELGPVTSAAGVLPAIARALDLDEADAGAERLAERIGARRLLLLLDNAEHVLGAAADLALLLRGTPALRLLVTSRHVLGIAGEHTFELGPLSLPAPGAGADEVLASGAGLLLAERAAQASAGFAVDGANAPALAAICARVDGLPLALELAASRLRLLEPAALAGRLERSLEALRERGTLRSTLAWSVGQLDGPERELLYALSVFRAAFPVEAAEEVGGGGDVLDALGRLVESSLVQRSGGGRFRLLTVVREHVAGLDAARDGRRTARLRHAAWVRGVVEEVAAELAAGAQERALRRVAPLIEDVHAAIAAADPAQGAAIALPLRIWWRLREPGAGRAVLAVLADEPALDRLAAAACRAGAADLAYAQADVGAARTLAAAAADELRRGGDETALAGALCTLGACAIIAGDPDARALIDESLATARAAGSRELTVRSLANLGSLAWRDDDLELAEDAFAEAVGAAQLAGDEYRAAIHRSDLAAIALERHDEAAARRHAIEAVAALERLGDRPRLALALARLAHAELDADPLAADELYARSLRLCLDAGNEPYALEPLIGRAGTAARVGDAERAAMLVGAAAATANRLGLALDSPMATDDAARLERAANLARAALDAASFARARAAGAALGLDEIAVLTPLAAPARSA
jgi:predicted ATPase/DNA-binding SARP family transcriptional activator